jgi:hypothetical protein
MVNWFRFIEVLVCAGNSSNNTPSEKTGLNGRK